ncbi:SPOR domain-containing protein [Magnetococcales bacterium HHB-1]
MVLFSSAPENTFANNRLYTIQVQATQEESVVQETLEMLRKWGYKPFVLSIRDHRGRTWQTVHIAKYRTFKSATKRLRKYKKKTGKDAVVVPTKEHLYRRFIARRKAFLSRLNKEQLDAAKATEKRTVQQVETEKDASLLEASLALEQNKPVEISVDMDAAKVDKKEVTLAVEQKVEAVEASALESTEAVEASALESAEAVETPALESAEAVEAEKKVEAAIAEAEAEAKVAEEARLVAEAQAEEAAAEWVAEERAEALGQALAEQSAPADESDAASEPKKTPETMVVKTLPVQQMHPASYLWIFLSLFLLGVVAFLLLKLRKIQQNDKRAQQKREDEKLAKIKVGDRVQRFYFPKDIPKSRLSSFIGRRNQLLKLRGALTDFSTGSFPKPQVIYGMGGVGKTELVVEYVYRHFEDYQTIWWIDRHMPTAIAKKMGLEQENLSAVWEDIGLWFATNDHWLIILDNMNSPQEALSHLPEGRGHVIITTRHANWGDRFNVQRLNPWSRGRARAFISRYHPDIAKSSVKALADAFGGFPLALRQVMTHLTQMDISIEAYLEQYHSDPLRFLSLGQQESARYPCSVMAAWINSIEQIENSDPVSMGILNLLAFLGSKRVPQSLILDNRSGLPSPLDHSDALTDLFTFHDKVVQPLDRNALITAERDTLNQHRLLQTVLRERLKPEERKRWIHVALTLVGASFHHKKRSSHLKEAQEESNRALLPHAIAVTEHAEKAGIDFERLARLLDDIVTSLVNRGAFEKAEGFCHRAVTITKEFLGGHAHANYGMRLNTLGLIFKEQERFGESLHLFRKAAQIDMQRFGPDYSYLAVYDLNMGTVFYLEKNWKEAEKYYKRSYEVIKKNGATMTRLATTCLINLGFLRLKAEGEVAANVYFEEALRREKIDQLDEQPVAKDIQALPEVIKKLEALDEAKKMRIASSRDMLQSADALHETLMSSSKLPPQSATSKPLSWSSVPKSSAPKPFTPKKPGKPNKEQIKLFTYSAKEQLLVAAPVLQSVEKMGASSPLESFDKLYRSMRAIKGGANLIGLKNISRLSRILEQLLERMRNDGLSGVDASVIERLLSGITILQAMVEDAANSDDVNVNPFIGTIQSTLDSLS